MDGDLPFALFPIDPPGHLHVEHSHFTHLVLGPCVSQLHHQLLPLPNRLKQPLKLQKFKILSPLVTDARHFLQLPTQLGVDLRVYLLTGDMLSQHTAQLANTLHVP